MLLGRADFVLRMHGMKMRLCLCAVAALCSTPAWAGCKVDPFHFYFGSDTSAEAHITGGGPCKITLAMGRNSGIESIAITEAAKHGSASTNGSPAYPEIYYRPGPGFRGSDQFTFTVKGGGTRLQGPSNVRVSITSE
jgi:hypothetical protein